MNNSNKRSENYPAASTRTSTVATGSYRNYNISNSQPNNFSISRASSANPGCFLTSNPTMYTQSRGSLTSQASSHMQPLLFPTTHASSYTPSQVQRSYANSDIFSYWHSQPDTFMITRPSSYAEPGLFDVNMEVDGFQCPVTGPSALLTSYVEPNTLLISNPTPVVQTQGLPMYYTHSDVLPLSNAQPPVLSSVSMDLDTLPLYTEPDVLEFRRSSYAQLQSVPTLQESPGLSQTFPIYEESPEQPQVFQESQESMGQPQVFSTSSVSSTQEQGFQTSQQMNGPDNCFVIPPNCRRITLYRRLRNHPRKLLRCIRYYLPASASRNRRVQARVSTSSTVTGVNYSSQPGAPVTTST